MKLKVLVVDEDKNFTIDSEKYFSSSESIDLVGVFNKGDSALKYIENNGDFDCIVLNTLLSNEYSSLILTKVNNLSSKKIVICTSEFMSKSMLDILNNYNPDYFLKKPFDINNLEFLILSLNNQVNKNSASNNIKVKITNLLHSLGIPSHIKGYSYIRDGVEMMYQDSSYFGAITKSLYPTIADHYDTTSSRVERAIRHAIEVSWIRGDYTLMESLFGNSVDSYSDKPTNSEFLATLADKLKLELA